MKIFMTMKRPAAFVRYEVELEHFMAPVIPGYSVVQVELPHTCYNDDCITRQSLLRCCAGRS